MTKDDAMVSKTLMEMLGLIENQQITIKYEFLSFLPSNFNDIQKIIFDYKPIDKTWPTKGQMFIAYFNIDPNITVSDLKLVILI